MIDEQGPENKKPDTNTSLTLSNGKNQGRKNTGNPEPNTASSSNKFRIRERFAKWRERRRVKWEAKWGNTNIHDRINVRHNRVIAYSTFLYMFFAGWTLIEIHSSSKAAKIQAIAQWGPDLGLNTELLRMKHDEQNVWVVLRVENHGKSAADDLRISAKLEFLDSRPTQDHYPTGYIGMTPNVLRPSSENGDFAAPVSPIRVSRENEKLGNGLYVWGIISYKTFGEEQIRRFCWNAPGEKVLNTKAGPKFGYGAVTTATMTAVLNSRAALSQIHRRQDGLVCLVCSCRCAHLHRRASTIHMRGNTRFSSA